MMDEDRKKQTTDRLTVQNYAMYLGSFVEIEAELYNREFGEIEAVSLNQPMPVSVKHHGEFSLDEVTLVLRKTTNLREDEAQHIVGLLREELSRDLVWDDEIIRAEFGSRNMRPFYHYLTVDGENFTTSDLKWSIGSPEVWEYLLENHFDLSGWIEQGLAIDASTLKSNPYTL